MKTTFVAITLFVSCALAQFSINTPSNVVECEPTLLTWSGGTGPYTLSIVPGASPNGAAIENLGQQNTTSVTWVCNIAQGTSIGLALRDSTGAIAQSAPFTVNPGSSSCLNSTSIVAGPTGGSSSGSGPQTTVTPSTTVSPSGSSSTTTSSTSKSSNGATMIDASAYGVVGALGAAVAALLL